MATTKAGPVNADRLKSFIERIEKLEEERKAIGGDVKDVYSEAKGVGYDVGTMRKIVTLRAKDAADRAEAETLLDVYRHALGMDTVGTVTVQAAPVDEEDLEARAGRIVMEVDRCMVLVENGRPPSIEFIRNLIGCSLGKASKLRGLVQSRISRENDRTREMKSPKPEDGDDGITESRSSVIAASDSGAPNPVEGTEPVVPTGNEGTPGERDTPNANEALATPSVGAIVSTGGPGEGNSASGPVDEAATTPPVDAVAASSPRVAPTYPDDDPGEPPEFLKGPSRRRQTQEAGV